MDQQLNVRLDDELKDRLDTLARSEGKSASQVVRDLISEYVRERDIESHIDQLWDRIGQQLRDGGYDAEDVDEAVQSVRESDS